LHEDEEDEKEGEAMESEKYRVFTKVLNNVQTSYLSLQSHNNVDIRKMIGSMKEDIRK
jgi:hypothetical protein